MDVATLTRAAQVVAEAFPDPWLRQYSLKANDVPAVVAQIAALGFGANVVSSGEWSLARRAGVPNGRITLEGVGKSDNDVRNAVRAAGSGEPLRWLAIESTEEAAVLARLAGEAGLGVDAVPRLDVLLRLNPDVAPETIASLAVGTGSSKFGLRDAELEGAITAGGGPQGPLRWRGLHLHVGSQLQALEAWRAAVRHALAVFRAWRRSLPDFAVLDIGGGFPVATGDQPVPAPIDFAGALREALDDLDSADRPRTLAIEPGRFIVARAGWIVARVLHLRAGRGPAGEPLAVIDAGMTELIRPALYGAHHEISALTSAGIPIAPSDVHEVRPTLVEGPICESTDRLGRHPLPPLQRGDLVAIADAGAYASSMSSRYNGRPRAAEVLLDDDGSLRLVRRRGEEEELAAP
jgi:diaminopimelate decarboxylase